jgi:hypothetical protein
VFIAFVQFAAMYLLLGTMIRLFTMKLPDNPVSHALMFAH